MNRDLPRLPLQPVEIVVGDLDEIGYDPRGLVVAVGTKLVAETRECAREQDDDQIAHSIAWKGVAVAFARH